ncbi:hypothetical protein HDU79_008885 [Rhizoclosmatium sp. JEL0117]|nr:hypothetical protein HDU79_008885 [Rhizoclosmatium sp. JEL0117]
MPDYGDIVDGTIFDQLLEMDDDDNREFSKGIARDFITQAETTLTELQESLEKKDLESLGRLGHFLKGSSAALGLKKLRATCENIQNYGRKVDEGGKPLSLSNEDLLKKLDELVKGSKVEYAEAKKWLVSMYQLEE